MTSFQSFMTPAESRECMLAEQSRGGGGGAKHAMLKGAMFAETRPLLDKTQPSWQLQNGEEELKPKYRSKPVGLLVLVSIRYQYQCWYRYYCPLDGFVHPEQVFTILC